MTISNENSAFLSYYVGRCTEIPTMYIRKFIIPPFLFSFKGNESTTFNYRNHAYPYTNTTNQTIFYYDLKPNIYIIVSTFLAHLSRRLKGELIVYRSIRRPWVRASVNIFKLEYLRNQWANRNQILSEASLGWGIDCIRFWTR